MIRHIVIWNYKDGFTAEENIANAKKMKAELENLGNLIPEIVSIKVHIEPLATGNMDIMLDSLFKSEADLAVYQDHPEHVRAGSFVRSVTQNRACIDFAE